MSTASNPGQRSGSSMAQSAPSLNPFPATAVAPLAMPSSDFWSIETEALKQARTQLRDYLKRTGQEQRQPSRRNAKGIILAIIGDYGTGKTHIAQDMLWQIALERNPYLHPLYLDAPSDTFLALYKDRFIKKLDRSEVLQRVDDYYADIVAEELGRSELTKPAAEALGSRKISPDEIVKKFGLMESKFVRDLDKKLKSVTEQIDFGTALLLLRRPEFQAAVWEWLEGGPPDTILRERGIDRQIADDATALEAIGVMAFLFGQQGHRFILFIDEIEKVLSHHAPHRPGEAAMLALKKLMEAMSRTRALLVLVGLPEFHEFLPEDARQRISSIIRPSAITANEIAQYIYETQRRATGTDTLEPFTMDTIDYLADIAGGNARKMVRLCYHAYLDAVKIGSTVTRAMLREIAREQFESASTEDITAELTHLIEARGWLYEKDKVLGSSESKQPVDYWLPVGEDGAGIAVFLSRSLLQEEEVQALATQAAKVAKKDTSGAAIETVLVINGYLADHLETEVKKAFGRVIVYRLRTFREALDSIVSGIRIRLEERNRENVLAAIKQRVDEIARQNRSIDNQLSHAAQRGVNRVELQAAVSAGLRAVFGHMASNISPSEVNYPQITALFDRAERKVNDLGVPDSLLDLVFGLPDARMREEEWYRLFRLRRRSSNFMDINTESFFRIASKVSVLKGYFSLFRRSIFTLLSKCSDLSSGSSGDFYYMSREILNDVCSLFDGYLNNTDFLTFVQEREPLRKMIDDVFEYVGANKYQLDREAGLISLSEPDVMRIREELRVFLHEVYDAVREELRRIEDVRYRP